MAFRGPLYRLSTACLALLGLAATTAAEDHLVSQRLSKRFFDDSGHWNMSFYHINDVHARLDEFYSSGADCADPARGCRGGYARVKQVLDSTRPDHPDSLFLNAGDEFQGTMFFSHYGGWKIAETLNQMGVDAMTLGNHEFDRGDDHLGEFLANLTFPIVCANVFSSHPLLNKTIKPYQIFEDLGVAVIGVLTETTPSLSSVGEGTYFIDPVKAVQDAVDHIRSTTDIKRIVALTHIGYAEDQRLARETTGVHLIMGGHSHTKLGTEAGSEGSYPTIVRNKDGDEVFVVTAWRWGEYLGYIDVTYDNDGKILAYHGAPINLNNKTAQDPGLQEQIEEWREPFDALGAEVIGFSEVVLDQTLCVTQECVLGNFFTDAMLYDRVNRSSAGTPPSFAITNSGGIRATIDNGNVTVGGVTQAFPFANSIVELSISGDNLWTTLEGIVSKTNQVNGRPVTSFLQVSAGVAIVYDPDAAAGNRLVSVKINGEALDKSKEYKFVTLDFLATGGDNFFDPVYTNLAPLDQASDVLTRYIKVKSPISIGIEGRIKTGKVSKCKRRRRGLSSRMGAVESEKR
ncbi:hypothetical protein OQA88_6020 [Cercophora sp. LCS_1]